MKRINNEILANSVCENEIITAHDLQESIKRNGVNMEIKNVQRLLSNRTPSHFKRVGWGLYTISQDMIDEMRGSVKKHKDKAVSNKNVTSVSLIDAVNLSDIDKILFCN